MSLGGGAGGGASPRVRPWGSLAWGLLISVFLVACSGPSNLGGPSASPADPGFSTAATAAPAGTPTAGRSGEAFVYFMADTRSGTRLVRETRSAGEGSLKGAVEAMIKGPVDPDYETLWNPETVVLSVTEEVGTITVDLSAQARDATADQPIAELMVQQLVYTVTANAPQATVRLLIDGDPAGRLWDAVTWDQGVGRGEPSDVLASVLVDRPQQKAQLTGDTLKVSGEALSGTTLEWRITLAGAGEEAGAGTVDVTGPTGFAAFSVVPELGPGRYVLEVRSRRADQPEVPLFIETKEFSVHLSA